MNVVPMRAAWSSGERKESVIVEQYDRAISLMVKFDGGK